MTTETVTERVPFQFAKIFLQGPKAPPMFFRWDSERRLYWNDKEQWGVGYIRNKNKTITSTDTSERGLNGYQIDIATRKNWEAYYKKFLEETTVQLKSEVDEQDDTPKLKVGDTVKLVRRHSSMNGWSIGPKWDGKEALVKNIEPRENGMITIDCEGTQLLVFKDAIA